MGKSITDLASVTTDKIELDGDVFSGSRGRRGGARRRGHGGQAGTSCGVFCFAAPSPLVGNGLLGRDTHCATSRLERPLWRDAAHSATGFLGDGAGTRRRTGGVRFPRYFR